MRIRTLATLILLLGAGTASAQPAGRPRILFDLAHGEAPAPPPTKATADKLGATLEPSSGPLTGAALTGVRLLYLRAPSAAIAPDERAAIVAFVRGGGSLLLVMDEQSRQDLAVVGANDLIEPFGLRLTPDTPYLHNTGALAKAGAINAADREVPYSGGRAVDGGTPFAFQLDEAGKPAQPFAASTIVAGGGRVVVMAEGMASLFLGDPAGKRRTGRDRDPQGTVYWGKDSTIFMEEVIGWLLRR
jgi:hypothetical protein